MRTVSRAPLIVAASLALTVGACGGGNGGNNDGGVDAGTDAPPAPICGNGVVESGEECDPPQPGACSSTCQRVNNLCGNLIIDQGEQCDPPQPSICTSACQFVPATCGDGAVQHGEECDPPNGTTCGSDCMLVGNCQACEMSSTSCDPSLLTLPGATSGFGCDSFTGALQSSCAALLDCIRSTHCATGDDPTPCYCGLGVDVVACATGTSAPSGVCLAAYNAALAGGPTGSVVTLFTNPLSPIGIADNLLTCDVDTPCPCGQ
jgi:hypothetical protein